MIRAGSIATGALLIAVAFGAAFGVADTRQGLIAEVVTLLSGLTGTGLMIYGLVPNRASAGRRGQRLPVTAKRSVARTANDLVIGGAGLLLGAALMSGLAISGGWLWAVLGGLLLLPMVAGSAYLVAAFIRDPERRWAIDLGRHSRRRAESHSGSPQDS